MRVKRQRRKLRGKYSGNCLSCSAKWSKCWYIASIENQREWETRLSKTVTPGADEVCFQCWDAKIRTSPKRKIHFKAEIPTPTAVDAVSSESTTTDTSPHLHATKRVGRNKRRALSGDFEYTIHTTSDFSSHLPSNDDKTQYDDFEDEGLYDDFIDDSDEVDSTIYEESVIFDEENAVILLSTAFRTIPHHIHDVNINININSYHDLHSMGDFTGESSFDDKSKKRGAYYCGKCGKLKKGHVCTVPSPKSESESPPSPSLSPLSALQSLQSTLTTLHSQLPTAIHLQPTFQPQTVEVAIPVGVAQPVGS